MILAFLSEHMRALPVAMLERVCLHTEIQTCEQQSVLYNAGDEPHGYYIVLQGARHFPTTSSLDLSVAVARNQAHRLTELSIVKSAP